jgi:hypothetical protein
VGSVRGSEWKGLNSLVLRAPDHRPAHQPGATDPRRANDLRLPEARNNTTCWLRLRVPRTHVQTPTQSCWLRLRVPRTHVQTPTDPRRANDLRLPKARNNMLVAFACPSYTRDVGFVPDLNGRDLPW